MKKTLLPFILLLLVSCKPCYQVFKVACTGKVITSDDGVVYENEDCKIIYDFWSVGGQSGFKFFNKTNENITVLLDSSFLILNSRAFDYFQNRQYSISNKTFAGSNTIQATGYSRPRLNSSTSGSETNIGSTYQELPKSVVPPHAYKIVEGFSICTERYRDCNLFTIPSSPKKAKPATYSLSTSPFVFKNIITYKKAGSLRTIENEFYVNQITNFTESEIFKNAFPKFCDQTSSTLTQFFTVESPDRFYLKYEVNNGDSMDH